MTKSNAKTTSTESTKNIRFVDSEDIDGAIKCVIFTPENWSETYVNIGLFDAKSAFKAIQEFLGETVAAGGKDLHVRSQEYSSYNGVKSFYVGGRKILKAIEAGENIVEVKVKDTEYRVSLPKTTDFIGDWVMCNTRLGAWARAVPCTDLGHVINQDRKHNLLELLFQGVKLVIYTEPSMVKGEVFNDANKAALNLKPRLLNEDGTFKTAQEIATDYFEEKRQYVDANKIQKQAGKIAKIAPVLNLPVANVIIVDGSQVSITDVPAGLYLATKDEVERPITHYHNLDSENSVRLLASRGFELTTRRVF